MNFKQQMFGVLSVVALTQVIKADYLISTFGVASPKKSHMCRFQLDGTILPHASDCQKFYVCVSNKPQEYNCDPNYHFDWTTHSCIAGAEGGNVEQMSSTCVDGTINTVADDCYSFKICVKGQYQKLNCPVNYYFHAPQGICVPLKMDAQFKCGCVLPEHTMLANENNCETYFVCQKKTSVLENCPLDKYYNSTVNACINDLDGICMMQPTITPNLLKEEQNMQHPTTDAKILCARLGAKNIQLQMFAEGCNKFSICVNGILHTQNCPSGFYYDIDKKYCVVDEENKCNFSKEQEVKQSPEKDLGEPLEQFQIQENQKPPAKIEELSYKLKTVKAVPYYQKPTTLQQIKLFSKFIKF